MSNFASAMTNGPDHARGRPVSKARVQLDVVFSELTEEQAERALAVLEASAELILTGARASSGDEPR